MIRHKQLPILFAWISYICNLTMERLIVQRNQKIKLLLMVLYLMEFRKFKNEISVKFKKVFRFQTKKISILI